ncbi:methylenetetrahydrofolate reductase [Pseudonocardia alni]|uniref:methylenetetrahydrofolate reductase n=1 Tax=Pseudonocardia alni TaxID=33907 RepID=UPI00280A9FF4|nr:methylenetetrahydrofolate reductase [Pseudonocardia alni]
MVDTHPNISRPVGINSGSPLGHRAALGRALRDATYEVLPFKSTYDKVLAHVSTDTALTVTTTEVKGLGPTVDLSMALSRAGYRTAPHLAARLVRDHAHLADLVDALRDAGVTGIFVIAGDAAEPVGRFADALSLLQALQEIGHPFTTVGIGGYPEGHGFIGGPVIEQATVDKAPYATQMITQLCFDAGTTVDWATRLRATGVDLPVRVGIPGAVSRQKLIRVSAGLGLGQSARFLKKQKNMFWRFFLPGGYSPNKLVERLTPAFADGGNGLSGFHVFTFNELESTEAWRQAWLRKLT